MYFTLQKYYPTKEQYGDTLHFCRHCSILFWKVRVPHVLWGREGWSAGGKLSICVLNRKVREEREVMFVMGTLGMHPTSPGEGLGHP